MTQTAQRAAIYVRISRDKAGEGLGVARQEQACRDLADRLGLQVADVFTDNDRSATSGKERPAYARMTKALSRGQFTHVIAWSNDRLQRDLGETFAFGQLVDKAGVTVETVTSGTLDFVDPERRVGTYVMSVLADAEVARRRARMLAKHRELAEQGKPTGGPRAFGYEDDRMTVRESEAEVIREVAARIIAGEGILSVCRDLNSRGITTAYGNTWKATSLQRTMMSPRLAGFRQHNGDTFPASWPGVLDEATWRKVCRRIERPRTRRASRKYLLTGLLSCSECNSGMVGRPSNGMPAYACAQSLGGCGRTLKAEPAEKFVERSAREWIERGDANKGVPHDDDELQAVVASLRQVEADLSGLDDDLADGLLTRAEWRPLRAKMGKRRDALRAERDRLEEEGDRIEWDAERWIIDWNRDDSTTRRAAMLATVVESIQVGPGRPGRASRASDRLDIRWA